MIRLAAALALLAFAAGCGDRQAGACDMTVRTTIAFTAPNAEDTITARSFGASCNEAIALYAVNGADGRPIWAWATPLPRAFGDHLEDEEAMQDFLARWAAPEVLTTAQAPAWEDLAEGQTTFDQLTYEDVRARDLPMLCHYSGTARQLCVFWEPIAGGAGHYYDRDIDEETPPA